MTTGKQPRSAVTGRFVTWLYLLTHPRETYAARRKKKETK
jgi:hypothetical protein